jgi:hypothetical protein
MTQRREAAAAWLFREDDGPTGPARAAGVRRVAGYLAVVLAVLTAAGFTVGTWNPWDYVRLQAYLGNPLLGAVIFFALVLLAVWLLPVRAEALDNRRIGLRWGLIAPLALAGVAYLLAGRNFANTTRVMAHSPSGHRTLAMVTGSGSPDAQLHVWAGDGWTARDLGDLGRPCGINVVVRFTDENSVHVSTLYGEFDLHLDPATGRPRDALSRDCTG